MTTTPPGARRNTDDEIAAMVAGIAPLDWTQMRLTAALTPAQRIQTGQRAAAFARAIYRGALMQRFPDLSPSELNMMVLRHFTTVRMPKP